MSITDEEFMKKHTIKKQMENIPIRTDYSANRYDTDNTHVIHLWDGEGNSYDIIISKGEH